MRPVAVSQRVTRIKKTGERRDSLDQQWAAFLLRCGFFPVLIPNNPFAVEKILKQTRCCAVLLTGGDDLARYGGDAPERDKTEKLLLKYALKRKLPVLGVCRGMQMIQDFYSIKLRRFEGHVTKKQDIRVLGRKETVNSYHHFGSLLTKAPLETWALADDGVIKAVRHKKEKICGIMWHPERFHPFRAKDVARVRRLFRS